MLLLYRAVAAKFDHKTDYMPAIIEATKDIDVQVIFNNAGYIVTGFFDQTKLDGQLANMECNGILVDMNEYALYSIGITYTLSFL